MTVSRRRFLAATAAASVLPTFARASARVKTIEPRPVMQQLAPQQYGKTPVWGYDGIVPGPEIRAKIGQRVKRRLVNSLPQSTAIHWHGIRIDNRMDGVPGVTQAAVAPGESFDYDFVVPDAGTFWYHSHDHSMEQVARGLHGPLIVEEAEQPDVDRDLLLALDDWRLDPGTVEIVGDFDNGHDLSHAGRIGNLLTVNGRFDPSYPVKQHERLRLRVVNVANSRVFQVGLDGLRGWIVALDGMPLEVPQPVDGSITLAPAQRADLIVDVVADDGAIASLLSVEAQGGFGVTRFPVAGRAATALREGVAALPPNPLPSLTSVADTPEHVMTMTGGAMRWLATAEMDGEVLDGRTLAQRGKFWALNGMVDRPETPFMSLSRGETVRISLVNDTVFPHAMHTHGHHFRVVGADGALGPWRDTVLVERGETRQIAMVADNPGDWLVHCHMLGHARAGMMSWFRVS